MYLKGTFSQNGEGGMKKKRHYSLEHYKLTNVTNLGWRKIKRKNKGNKGGKDFLMNVKGE